MRNSKNTLSGSTLTQILLHCLHYGCPEFIAEEVVQRIIEDSNKDNLDAKVYYQLPLGVKFCHGNSYSGQFCKSIVFMCMCYLQSLNCSHVFL